VSNGNVVMVVGQETALEPGQAHKTVTIERRRVNSCSLCASRSASRASAWRVRALP